MSSYEVLSIVSLSVSVFVAVACFLVPMIINALNSRRERREREREFLFEEQYSIFKNLAFAFADWKSDASKEAELLRTIYWTAAIMPCSIKNQLIEFANAVSKNADNADERYYECSDSIAEFFNVYADWACKDRILLTAKIRHNVKDKRKY